MAFIKWHIGNNGVKEDEMQQRYLCIWFRSLVTDWFVLRNPVLKEQPFVLAAPVHGRMLINACNVLAGAQGIIPGMTLADARGLAPELKVLDDVPDLPKRLLMALGEWCIRYTPVVATDLPDGLLLDISGCAHLWGGERSYLKELITRLRNRGYDARGAIADTVGTAWAVAHYGTVTPLVASGEETTTLLSLPPAALRLQQPVLEKMQKLGLYTIGSMMGMQRTALRRRFGQELLLRLDQALGVEAELLQPIQPVAPYCERLPCLEPIVTAAGIEIAVERLLEQLCRRLQSEGKGLRTAILKVYRIDGVMVQASIHTGHASHHMDHLFRLLSMKIPELEPGEGIELFLLEASGIAEATPAQEALWEGFGGLEDAKVAELLDRLQAKISHVKVLRYLPDEHHWPEWSVKLAASLLDKPVTDWRVPFPRPIHLLLQPELIEVTVPIPDYPPMMFRYKGKLHKIVKADVAERKRREWWLNTGEHRDYYQVEDEEGQRYWLFRSGHYDPGKKPAWFIHGFFA